MKKSEKFAERKRQRAARQAAAAAKKPCGRVNVYRVGPSYVPALAFPFGLGLAGLLSTVRPRDINNGRK